MKNNILFVCPTDGWGFRERTAIKDILVAKERGENVYLFALKDSYIDLRASELNIPVIHFYGKLSTKILKWRKLKLIPSSINKLKITVVHCYDVDLIWPVAYFLRKAPLVTCILSVFTNIKRNYRSFVYKTLAGRIDLVFNYNTVHHNNIVESLNVLGMKIHPEIFPVNIHSENKISRGKFLKKMGIEKETDIFLIGSYIDVNTENIDELAPLLNAINVFIRKTELDCRLVLFNEKNWGNSLIYPEIIKYMKQLGIEDSVVFYRANSQILSPELSQKDGDPSIHIEEIQSVLDLWINIELKDCLDDFMVSSLLSGVPILGVRMSSLKDFFSKFQGVGGSYGVGDSREIRTKIEEILNHHKKYKQNIKKALDTIELKTDFSEYSERMDNSYKAAARKRRRFFKQIK